MSSMDHYTHIIDGHNTIYYICKFSSNEIIEHVLDYYEEDNLNLEWNTGNNWWSIHFIYLTYDEQMVNYILYI